MALTVEVRVEEQQPTADQDQLQESERSSAAEELRRRLERLGLRLGAGGLRAQLPPARPPAPPRDAIEQWVSGRECATVAGRCFLSENRYPLEHVHGMLPLGAALEQAPTALRVLADDGVAGTSFERFAFLDTETTGLAGGTGTYAFLVGIGTFEDGEFVVRQFFMRDIPEEPALLALVRETLAAQQGLVTFNGRAFDWPLLQTRLTLNRQPTPTIGKNHLDLLLPARRLWRLRLSSCALSSLEARVLGVQRTVDDVPGWAIPGLYRDFLVWGRAEPLRRVFYHNAHDILSLATLATLLCRLAQEPLNELRHGEDLFSLAQRHEAQGDIRMALRLYQECLRAPLSHPVRRAATRRMAGIYRQIGQAEEAVALWQALADSGDSEALISLAKYYEHHARDLDQAHKAASRALASVRQHHPLDRIKIAELEHRLERLERKREHRCGGSRDRKGS